MEKLPKFQEFSAPEGYFEGLPDKILLKTKKEKTLFFVQYVAAASILITLGFWYLGLPEHKVKQLTLEEEALLYIESNQWSSEDVLGLSENPNEILDLIIQEELGNSEPLWIEDENWF
jgi:hypothetical protein